MGYRACAVGLGDRANTTGADSNVERSTFNAQPQITGHRGLGGKRG
jgi:hypothetical protein